MLVEETSMTEGSPSQPGTAEERPALAAHVRELRMRHQSQSMTLGEILEALGDRAHLFLIILLCVPLTTPVPLPGVAIFFGYITAVIGYRLAFGKSNLLPKNLRHRSLSPKILDRMLGAAHGFFRALDKMARPRLGVFMTAPVWTRIYGLLICLDGWLLLLPLPIPLTNGLPALAIVFMAAALLARDGAFGLLGMAFTFVTVIYFIALVMGGVMTVDWLVDGELELHPGK